MLMSMTPHSVAFMKAYGPFSFCSSGSKRGGEKALFEHEPCETYN